MMFIPRESVGLINALDGAYPHRCIGRGQPPEEAHRYAGKRELIDMLLIGVAREEADSAPTATPNWMENETHV